MILRRKEKEILSRNEIDNIINKAKVCRISLIDEENMFPYIIPVNFGYDGKNIFIHTAKVGKKIDLIKNNNNVCFEIDIDVKILHKEKASKCSTAYKSLIGFGKAYFIDEIDEKKIALDELMKHYSSEVSNREYDYSKCLDSVGIIKIDIISVTGKQSLD